MPIATKNINAEKIQGNLDITSVTSSFTGSYIGDGAGLYNIPAAGIVGLNLSQISSGSVSASIDPVNGLQINTNVTAISFTGSFTGSYVGSGAGLYNIPASGITGLNLSQIASGSATASISPDNGFQINTNTTITGSLTVTAGVTASLFGTASWAFNSVTSSYAELAATASYVLNAISSSFSATASYALNAGTTIDTGSFVTTSSFASYTGSTASQFAGTASFANFVNSASFAATASYVNLGAITLINPIVQYYDTTSSILAGTTVTLPGGLTFVSSSQFEYIEIFINGLRLRYDRDFFPISSASVQYQLSIPAGSEITYKSLYR